MAEIKRRKIRKEDWTRLAEYVTDTLNTRKADQFRRDHEQIWTEIDRQVAMKPMTISPKAGARREEVNWRNVLELGELSKAKEIIEADVMRITFPQDRRWFEAHTDLGAEFGPQGVARAEPVLQQTADDVYRSFISQQLSDFGFYERVQLSIGEALVHGSFVAEVDWETQMMVDEGVRVSEIGAPVWKPLSMWNCYPDPSPSIVGSNMFYGGSMLLCSWMSLSRLKEMKGPGWMPAQYKMIEEQETTVEGRRTKDVKLVKYYGDCIIDRGEGEIYLPNAKVIVANDKWVVYYEVNDLPYPSVILGGYHKGDVRDPYFTSPLIKMSPMQKMGSKLGSRFLDGVDLKTEKPLTYDGNDPQFVMDGGPTIAPGAKYPSKYGAETKLMDVGEPEYALRGLELILKFMQEGLGVSSTRSGAVASDRATAYEIAKVSQGGEVRTVEFIRKLTGNLRAFLYMQHALNKKKLVRYSFYNDELNTRDFMRITRDDIPDAVHFEVVGAKGMLGEEQRINRTTAVTAFASGNPLFAPLLEPRELLLEMYRDAGQKNPERFVSGEEGEDPRLQQMQQALQELQQALQEAQSQMQVKIAEIEVRREGKQADTAVAVEKIQSEYRMRTAELIAKTRTDMAKIASDVSIQRRKNAVDLIQTSAKQASEDNARAEVG